MPFVETPIFTRRLTDILDDEHYGLLQKALAERPTSGPVIPGSGGLRKLRWTGSGRGKRGGSRFIYYWSPDHDRILMLRLRKERKGGHERGAIEAIAAACRRGV